MKKYSKELIGIISIIGISLLIILILNFVPVFNMYKNTKQIYINEIMSSNKSTIVSNNGKYYDYIEIYNNYDYDIDLTGYHLSDDINNTLKWSFPSITIKSKSYLIIYASGKNGLIDDELHCNFKIDTKGENIMLSDDSNNVISKVYSNLSLSDTSYGYNGKEYVYYYKGTPGSENTGEYSTKVITSIKKLDVININEYLINNINIIKSFDNNYYSVIELYNDNDFDVNLNGYYLSDKIDNKGKYKFGDISIKSKNYLLVFCSGLDKVVNNEIHTNFKLNDKDGFIVLSDSNRNIIDRVNINETRNNISGGIYDGKWYSYSKSSLGNKNDSNYIKDNIINDLVINEVSLSNVEIYNKGNNDINLSNYSIGTKNINKNLSGTIKSNGYYYTSLTLKSNEELYLYNNGVVIDTFNINKLNNNISTGIYDKKIVYYKSNSFGKENSSSYLNGYTNNPSFSNNGGYLKKGESISLIGDGTIYYTLNGTTPTTSSSVYKDPIVINNNTVIKCFMVKDGYIESDVVSRTYIVDRTFDLPFVSISGNGISSLVNTTANYETPVSFEYYESNGSFGVMFNAGAKLTGCDSRQRPQKSVAIYLRSEYGVNEVTYPFFKNSDVLSYSSFTLRNAGEDPIGIRIMDATLGRTLKGQMDIDMQEYQPVVVYINGSYYGMLNLREKLNGDYVESHYGLDKDNIDVIKYQLPTTGNSNAYNNLVSYVKSHNCADDDVYKYLETQIDMQEFANYLIVESYYGNTDLGNIRYWKDKNGKWRWMAYDFDWSLWRASSNVSYPVISTSIPAATYLSSTYTISRALYKNSKFRDLYLSTFAYHMKNTFVPSRMNDIVDELAKEIENEMPYHINRWGSRMSPNSMSNWRSNLNLFKNRINNRYNSIKGRIKSDFGLSNSEYNKYFGGL